MASKKKKASESTTKLDPRKLGVKIQDMHRLVRDEMNRRGLSAYEVAKRVAATGSKMTEQTLRNFLNGANMRSHHLAAVFAVLGLEVKPKR